MARRERDALLKRVLRRKNCARITGKQEKLRRVISLLKKKFRIQRYLLRRNYRQSYQLERRLRYRSLRRAFPRGLRARRLKKKKTSTRLRIAP
jgi:hypothetical protein